MQWWNFGLRVVRSCDGVIITVKIKPVVISNVLVIGFLCFVCKLCMKSWSEYEHNNKSMIIFIFFYLYHASFRISGFVIKTILIVRWFTKKNGGKIKISDWKDVRAAVAQGLSEGCWFDSPGLHVKVSLGKILNPLAHCLSSTNVAGSSVDLLVADVSYWCFRHRLAG